MTGGFADHFSRGAAAYAQFRPRYPDGLFRFLADVAPGRRLAWDCGTGSGQAAVGLASHFEQVRATDPSRGQLAHAEPHPRVTYAIGRESASGLADRTADLVTAAQAAHWFDLDAFYAEARRVLVHTGVLAVWCYGAMHVDPTLDPLLDWFYGERVGRHWPPERALVDAGFTTLPFPFDELSAPHIDMQAAMTRDELLGYVGTWSAVARARDAEHVDPMRELSVTVAEHWPDAAERRTVHWPLGIRVGRVG